MLTKYIRDNKRRRRGMVVALDATHIGWSLCRKGAPEILVSAEDNHTYAYQHADDFDAERALEIAVGRATKGVELNAVAPSARKEFLAMQERAQKYFKGAQV